ncbi:hypothetical protein SDC9_72319 [bioreactor metagenome]|uniref:Uncharacterized protein n=1 Tax=bioreactor metagenome TaxID=1076179 RepID=A0A644YBZ9_9ZZZZ
MEDLAEFFFALIRPPEPAPVGLDQFQCRGLLLGERVRVLQHRPPRSLEPSGRGRVAAGTQLLPPFTAHSLDRVGDQTDHVERVETDHRAGACAVTDLRNAGPISIDTASILLERSSPSSVKNSSNVAAFFPSPPHTTFPESWSTTRVR